MAKQVSSCLTGPLTYTTVTVGQQESQDYAKKAYQWAKALKLLDPTIKLVSCGGTVPCCFAYGCTHALIQKPDMRTGIV